MLSLSVIIPYRESENVDRTVGFVHQACQKTGIAYEILLVSGNHPTRQRNQCVKKAKYSWVYFIDNDTRVHIDTIVTVISTLEKYPDTKILGGPAITPDDNTLLQKTFGAVFSSPLAVGKVAARYSPVGALRTCTDKELILCNLFVEREFFIQIGMFNDKLYPNEENEFIHRAVKAGYRVMYNPSLYIEKDQRERITDFIKQLVSYGRGRGEQTRIQADSFSTVLIIPIAFFLYFISMPFFLMGSFLVNWDNLFRTLTVMPFIIYIPILLVSWLFVTIKYKKIFPLYPIIFWANHFFYGYGEIKGLLLKRFKAQDKDVYYNIVRP